MSLLHKKKNKQRPPTHGEVYRTVIEGLQKIYETKIKPVEQLYMYEAFHSPLMKGALRHWLELMNCFVSFRFRLKSVLVHSIPCFGCQSLLITSLPNGQQQQQQQLRTITTTTTNDYDKSITSMLVSFFLRFHLTFLCFFLFCLQTVILKRNL